MIVRVDALGLYFGTGGDTGGAVAADAPAAGPQRTLVAEVLGGFFGLAGLGRWWLPCALLDEGAAPAEAAALAVKRQVGLDLSEAVVVGARPQRVGDVWHLGLVVAGSLSGQPAPAPPVTGFSLRLPEELPDQIGLWHRDDLLVLAARYERLRG